MVKVKNARVSGPLYNPFANVNQHGAALLDLEEVRQLCLQSGKGVKASHLNALNFIFLRY